MKKIFYLAITLTVISSCYNDKEELLYPSSFGACDSANATNYASIKTIIDAKCATSGCHISGGTSPDLSNYTSVAASKDRVMQRACIDKNMPAGAPLSACEIGKLTHWINLGAPQN